MTFLEYLKIVGLVLGGIWAYLTVGGLFVVAGATISKLKGGKWFAKERTDVSRHEYRRWSYGGWPEPVFVFFLWPLFIVLGPPLAAFMSLGEGTEGLANRIHALIERRQDAMAKLAKPKGA